MRPEAQACLAVAATFVAAVGLSWLVRSAAWRVGMVSHPRTDRWAKQPTALLGGVAVFASVVLAYLTLLPALPSGGVVLSASAMLFLLGLTDDLFHLKPYQ